MLERSETVRVMRDSETKGDRKRERKQDRESEYKKEIEREEGRWRERTFVHVDGAWAKP